VQNLKQDKKGIVKYSLIVSS